MAPKAAPNDSTGVRQLHRRLATDEPQSSVGSSPATKIDQKTVGGHFVVLASVVQLGCCVLFILNGNAVDQWWTEDKLLDAYGEDAAKDGVHVANSQLYNNYIGVTLMMFIGFGYLMTFLRHYGLGALGLTMFITCVGMQCGILCVHMFGNMAAGKSVPLKLGVMQLLYGDFAVAAFLISFGGIIGKASPTQLLILVVLEAVFFSINQAFITTKMFAIQDCGGTIVIHMFGAYFGLAVAWVLGKPTKGESKETNSQVSDLFSLIGTLFLWLYWPSFVAGALPPGTTEAETAVTNTVMALLGSTVVTFIVSAALNGNVLRPVDIQNATLAGGVTIGCLANVNLEPGYALLVGAGAGLLSTVGFARVQDILKATIGLHDSCGIHNLHGMPSVLGAILSAILPTISKNKPGVGVWGTPGSQLGGMVATLVVSISTGLFTGFVMMLFRDGGEAFDDKMYWEVAEEDAPEVELEAPAAVPVDVPLTKVDERPDAQCSDALLQNRCFPA